MQSTVRARNSKLEFIISEKPIAYTTLYAKASKENRLENKEREEIKDTKKRVRTKSSSVVVVAPIEPLSSECVIMVIEKRIT